MQYNSQNYSNKFINKIKIMSNGKISQWFKSNWRTCLYVFAIFAGVVCGVWACSKSSSIDVDANRNRVNIVLSKTKTK